MAESAETDKGRPSYLIISMCSNLILMNLQESLRRSCSFAYPGRAWLRTLIPCHVFAFVFRTLLRELHNRSRARCDPTINLPTSMIALDVDGKT